MMPSKRWSLLLVFVLVGVAVAVPTPGLARLDDHGDHGDDGHESNWCGTNRSNLAVALGISHSHHREELRIHRDPEPEDKAAIAARSAEAVGDIAVISDDRVFRHVNPLDLGGAGILFTPKAKGYTVTDSSGAVAEALVTRLELGDDATVFVPFVKGFKPKFYGKAQGGMFVNSDGNITFGSGDDLSTERGLQRFLLGPGRIAPLFMDLDPTLASGDSGIYVSTSKTLVIVTWLNVAEFGNANRRNTFQVKIDKTGRVTFAYGDLGSREAVTGIAPGDGGAFTALDFQEELPVTLNGAVAEQFSLTESLDDVAVMQVFLESFADRYDSVIVWLDFPYILGGRAFAYEFSVKNDIRGIGQPIFDATRQVGSRGRLSSFVQMGSLANYPADHNTTFLGTNTTLDVLGQEVGHRWLAFLAVFQAGNPSLLGRSFAHWSFFFDSKASDMEGNGIRDNGNGTFTTVEATSRYSPLDQYVMGLRGPSEVEDMFYVANAPGNPGDAPEVGITFSGERRDVRIEDIVAAEGPRVPSSATAAKSFNQAFILVTRAGSAPSAGSVEKLERIRAAWVDYWVQATDGRSTVDTTMVPR
jgi:hypothetical protein